MVQDMRTIAVVPAYNESETIGPVVRETLEHVDDVVVIDDGSDDETADIARQNGATVVQHVINTGVGGALRTGYRYAMKKGFDIIVQIDADGQHDPDYIPMILEAIEDRDMVIGSRYLNESFEQYSLVRKVGIQFFTRAVNLLGGTDITDVTSGFRAYRVESLQEIIHESDDHWAVEQTLEAARKGQQISELSVEMPTREEGESQFSLETFVMYPLRMMDIIVRVLIFR